MAEEAEDLEEAMKADNEARLEDLRASVDDSKSKLARLQEKMARAKSGATEEVLEEREDLREAMRAQMNAVQRQIRQSVKAAREYNEMNDQATKLLQESAPPNVRAKVEVDVETMPPKIDVGANEHEATIRYETNPVGRDRDSKEADSSRDGDAS